MKNNNILTPNFLTLLFLAIFSSTAVKAETKLDSAALPRVSVLGEVDESTFEKTQRNYSTSLVEACHNDMETAYYAWLHLLKHLETFAKQQGVETDGMKLYFYVFWNRDGSIAHISYFPKPNSRNLREEETKRFNKLMDDFTKVYKFPIKYERNFSNYNHANFPVLIEKLANTPK
ncbi:MAG: hypothetical protein RL757_3131 [Bacteroidota bacterium]|jgi:hypothetical protein